MTRVEPQEDRLLVTLCVTKLSFSFYPEYIKRKSLHAFSLFCVCIVKRVVRFDQNTPLIVRMATKHSPTPYDASFSDLARTRALQL
jgi:hypothetical protein